MSSLISDSKCRAYGPKGVRFTPKGDKTGVGKTALTNTGTYLILSQYNTHSNEHKKFKNSKTFLVPQLPGVGLSPRHGHGEHLLDVMTSIGVT